MNGPLENLITALREELTQYGEMLVLLDQQQEQVMARASAELLATVTEINRQSANLQAARQHRERCHQELARQLGVSQSGGFAELLPRLPDAYRPLVGALVDENNQLLARIRQRARQNHLLLNRSIELLRRLLGVLAPGGKPTVYDSAGQLWDGPLGGNALYDAVG